MADLSIRGMFRCRSASIIEFSKWVLRHHVTKELGLPCHPFLARKEAAALVNPVCMSTTVPYWSNMQTLMEALTSSSCAIPVPSKCCDEPLPIAVNHYAPRKPEECKEG